MDAKRRDGGVAIDHGVRQESENAGGHSRNRLSDQQWLAIVDMLPERLGVRARNRTEHYRKFIESVLWVVGEEAMWVDLPEHFGSWRAAYVRFLRWNSIGAWDGIAEILGRDAVLARALLTRTAQHAAVVRKRLKSKSLRRMLEG